MVHRETDHIPRLLIVEDEAVIALSQAQSLRDAGFEVETVHSGEGALERLFERRDRTPEIDLVLMDINLGRGIDGIETAERILRNRTVPIVFLTGHSERDTVERVRGLTRYGYVMKDSGPSVLVESVHMALELFQAHHRTPEGRPKHGSAAQTSSRLEDSELRWQYALESAGDGLWDWDATTNRVFFSRHWKLMLGFDDDEIGDGLEEWESRIHPDDYDTTMQVLQAHLSGHTDEYRHEHRLQCRDGSYKWILDRGKVVKRDASGAPIRVIGTHTDLDERVRLQAALARSEAKYRGIAETTSFGIWIVDAAGILKEANPAYAEMSGYSQTELIGMPIHELDANEDADLVRARMAEIERSGAAVFETAHRRADGTVYPVSVRANRFSSESGEFFAIIEDITHRRAAEEQEKRLMRQRELMLREGHHRTKNDMQTVQAFLSLQADRAPDQFSADALTEAAGRIGLMTTLYDRIYSSIDIGEDVELKTTVSALAEQLAARYPDTAPDIRTHGEPVYVPRNAATPVSVMVNELMTNAVKYGATPGGGSPRIDVELRRAGAERVSITIRDSGAGFPETVLDGTAPGLGLTIVEELAKQVHAELTVRNDAHDGGAEVSLVLPTADNTHSH